MITHAAAFDELDLATLYGFLKLRSEVFIVEQNCPYLDLDGLDAHPGARHVWIEEKGEVVAYLRVLDIPDGSARIGRVCVSSGHRGRGLADAIMAEALRVVGDRPCWLHAQSQVSKLYERHGFTVSGPEFIEDDIPHLPMARPSNH
ncbi:MAG: GNAT family N-acetyltransferase [Longispora sp.]|nr:GNAT family N-acetyltransferase [Longispora sp. (in: high G+C Gram-positive bacteria)]